MLNFEAAQLDNIMQDSSAATAQAIVSLMIAPVCILRNLNHNLVGENWVPAQTTTLRVDTQTGGCPIQCRRMP